MYKIFLLVGLMLSVYPVYAQESIPAGEYVNDPLHTSVTFRIKHLGFSYYAGRFNTINAQLTLDPDNLSQTRLTASVDISTIDTNSDHLYNSVQQTGYFHTSQYPIAEFTSTCIHPRSDNTAQMLGNLTIKGVTRRVAWDVELVGHGKNPFSGKYVVGFHATTTIKRSEWGITQALPAIGDEVSLTIAVEFVKT